MKELLDPKLLKITNSELYDADGEPYPVFHYDDGSTKTVEPPSTQPPVEPNDQSQ